jgi:cell division protease FtsH
MGGRVAEEQVFGSKKVTSGAASDIEQATKLARAMVTRWGFSEAVGRVALGENQEEVFLGHSVARTQNISEETSRKIDHEVRRLVDEGYDEAQRILTEHKDELEALAQGLLEFETLNGEEIKICSRQAPRARGSRATTRKASRGTSAVPRPAPSRVRAKGGDTGLEPQPT